MNAQRTEKGQVLVLIILAIVAIFGFAALAVDAGRIYSERRRSQSAADSAAMAAAFTATEGGDFVTKAFTIALTNGFDNNGTTNTVTVNHPPVSGPYAGEEEYYQVIIWQHVDPVFAQIIFPGQESVTTEAVARARPVSSVSTGNAVHSLDPGDDSMIWDGNVDLHVTNGNIYSNGNIKKKGHSGSITVTDGEIYAGDQYLPTGNPNVTPSPHQGAGPEAIADITTPYCPNHDDYDAVNNVHYYYHSGLTSSATLQPGFHCFYGDIKLTGGDMVQGNDVVLVMKSGGITMRGNSQMILKRPNDIIDKNGNHYGGLLIYAPPDNHSNFELGGTADSWFTGTVLIPSGTCDIGGTPSGTGMHAALICWRVRNHGTSDVNIYYREEEQFRLAPMVELSQ